MAGPKKKPALPEIPPKAKVVKGDLVVTKDHTFKGATYVQGNVIVGGVLQERAHSDVLIATGSIKAKAIKSGGLIYAGKGIEAEVVYLELEGTLGAVGGLDAQLVVLEDADCAVGGKVTAEQKITLSFGNPAPLKKLQKLLAPHAFGLVDEATEIDDDAIFDYSFLMGAISRGKPWQAGKAAPKAAKWSRHFEFKDGSSNKFWEVTVDGDTMSTRYGKVGTPGQTTKKPYDGPEDADLEANKLIKEKTKKGYRESKPGAAKSAPAKPAKKSAGARYFEFNEGTSSKFWEVSIEGTSVRTRYGKIGTPGQVTMKPFGDAAKADAERDKLIREKTKKGYAEK